MIPPKRLEIGWWDLAMAGAAVFFAGGRPGSRSRAERALGGTDDVIACLSVRSGFDLLLGSLGLPAGSEVLVSAITVGDMVRIIREHGLVPVPVDVDPESLSVSREALVGAWSPRSKAVLVAHVFGTRMDLAPVVRFANERGLMVIEDCAQAFEGDGYTGAPGADVTMFSFGPIKTLTCLGGGLLRVTNPRLLDAMRRLQSGWPIQPRRRYFTRVIKCAAIKALSSRGVYSVAAALLGGLGLRVNQLAGRAVRGFPGPVFFARIRRQPSTALLSTMARRIGGRIHGCVAGRRRLGERVAAGLAGVLRPGRTSDHHSYWVFPVLLPDPDKAVAFLEEGGFGAVRGTTSLIAAGPVPERPMVHAREAERLIESVVFLPVYPGVPLRRLRRLGALVGHWLRPDTD